MRPSIRKRGILLATAAVVALSGVAVTLPIRAAFSDQLPMMNQTRSDDHQMPGMMQHMVQMHGQGSMEMGVNA